MKEQLTILMIVALAFGVLAPTVHAGMSLSLDDGVGNAVTIDDGDAADASLLAGVIIFNGPLGNWVVNVTTGLSKPVLGPADLDLNSVNVTSPGPGNLTIMLTDTDFTLPSPLAENAVLESEIGGTAGGTLTLTQILDRENNEFAIGSGDFVSLVSGPFGPGAFSDTQNAAAPLVAGSLFSLTEVVVISHLSREATTTSFDAHSHVVPVPGAILLGFLGLGAAGLKLRRFA